VWPLPGQGTCERYVRFLRPNSHLDVSQHLPSLAGVSNDVIMREDDSEMHFEWNCCNQSANLAAFQLWLSSQTLSLDAQPNKSAFEPFSYLLTVNPSRNSRDTSARSPPGQQCGPDVGLSPRHNLYDMSAESYLNDSKWSSAAMDD
jgi:hypothetical protein